MPVTGTLLKIIVRYVYLNQNCENVGWYTPGGAAFLTATMDGVLEAYWNDVKAAWHDMAYNDTTLNSIDSVLGYEMDGALGYAEFPVPALERVGIRTVAAQGQPLPGTLAGAVRLTVGSTVTRPGQKRAPFIGEANISGNDLDPTYLARLATWGETYSNVRILGAPVATGILTPQVVHIDRETGAIGARQDITGQVVNPYASSQVSRKRGHGS